jgi:glycosyltransferase involved in cell wall biosynthesis
MRVFFLPRWFPFPDDPLWGLFVLRHAQAVSRFAEVAVIYVDKQDKGRSAAEPFVTNIEGVNVLYWFYRTSSLPLVGRALTFIRMAITWHKAWHLAVKEWGKPDIHHVHILTRMGLWALCLKVRHKIPYVITEHWSRYLPQNLYYRGWLRKIITRRVVRGSGAVMPVTQDLAAAMHAHGLKHNKYIVVPNVVDTDLFSPDQKRSAKGITTFVHISTFDDRAKNISGLLRVFARLRESGSGFQLKLIGDGADYQVVHHLAVHLGLEAPYVEFAGALTKEDVAAALAASDMLLIFSNYENMPVVINEALSCGVPVLATRVGGIPEVIHPGNGILVNPGDEEALYDALFAFTVSPPYEQFDRDAIRAYATERFDMDAVGKMIIGIYIMVLNKAV